MTLRPRVRVVLVLLVSASGLAAGCGSVAALPGQPAKPAGTHRASTPAANRTAAAREPSATSRPTHSARRGPARQLITVTTPGYGATYATLTAYAGRPGRWNRVFGPWTARIGRNGFAPPGRKREGDGRTPSGSFGIQFLFGVMANPGVRFAYRRIHPFDFWDDDPASSRYNEWVDQRRASPGASPEPMDVPGYDYGAVIGYNTTREPGLGSGIFLHVNIGIATAGCITLPAGKLLAVLRWLDPARSPRIKMGAT
jgi:L,D-peptidoglycan transpeptidase YkuD (ErfK/YbiS/YcfS/YnhG family)